MTLHSLPAGLEGRRWEMTTEATRERGTSGSPPKLCLHPNPHNVDSLLTSQRWLCMHLESVLTFLAFSRLPCTFPTLRPERCEGTFRDHPLQQLHEQTSTDYPQLPWSPWRTFSSFLQEASNKKRGGMLHIWPTIHCTYL